MQFILMYSETTYKRFEMNWLRKEKKYVKRGNRINDRTDTL